MLWRECVDFKQISWCNPAFLERHDFSQHPYEIDLSAKTRYRQTNAPCSMAPYAKSNDPHLSEIATAFFAGGQWAVTPGQSIVLYQKDVCLGGGVII
jgi:tRNA U34 2-thiouridine synthase MnmA/TrmU